MAELSSEKIMSALRKSGYLMEQEVATQLESFGFHVKTNVAYKDPDEEKSREIDVLATKQVARNEQKKLAAFFELVVECKNSSQPIVFIGRPKNSVDDGILPVGLRFPIHQYEARWNSSGGISRIRYVSPLKHLEINKVHYAYEGDQKAVQFCRLERKGAEWNANHSGLYDAIFYPIGKMVQARLAKAPENSRNEEWKYFWFVIPILVTSAELFYVNSVLEQPYPEPRTHVNFRRELRGKTVEGHYSLDFVRRDGLASFLDAQLGPLAERLTQLVDDSSDLVLRRDIEWTGEPLTG